MATPSDTSDSTGPDAGVDAVAVRAVLDTMVSCRAAADRLEADLLALAVELVALHPVDDDDCAALAAPRGRGGSLGGRGTRRQTTWP